MTPRPRSRLLIPAAALLAAGLLLASSHAPRPPMGGGAPPPPAPGKWKSVEEFAGAHWAYPLPPMGPPPPGYGTPEERSLLPRDCGKCHEAQYEQWRTTLHGRAMGPGVYGQLVDLWASDPEQARGCNECHAPLAEQQKKRPAGAGPLAGWGANPAHLPELEMAGLACAACHVRNWRVHGPPKRDTPEGVNDATTSGDHGGVERTPFFERAEFCMKCHQHTFPGPNGKAIQNTYNEWRASIWAEEGVPCQKCHMPKRRHLWRGIHDKDMTQGALGVEVEFEERAPKDVVAARILLTNQGAGHHFPTYITPAVDVIAELEDAGGRPLPGTRMVHVIERKLSADFSQEISDTRIPAQATRAVPYRRGRPEGAARLRLRVRVRPDAFYLGFFGSLLANPNLSPRARRLLGQARDNARNSPYDIYDERFELGGGGG